MPTYEYRCDNCGHEMEEFQSITAKSLKKCPECKKSKLKRLIGIGAAVIFKGSGFYETDYRSSSYQKAAKADTQEPSTSDKTDKSEKSDKAEASASSPSESKNSQSSKPQSDSTKKSDSKPKAKKK
ncbi:MAG: zinc ribbon domain-containing protein [Phycisphaeraceae bacterium]|nr:zinc ribbon domain-containing protein [Phycisphaeraceae bacterium]